MSFFTKITNADNHPEGTLLQEITALIVRGGIWNTVSDMIASEKAAGADLSVDISKGDIFLKRDSFCRPCWTDQVENVTINAESSGNDRITTIIAYVDLVNAAGASGQGADVTHFKAIDGTPSASPVAPSTATIEAEIGSSDPYEIICDVAVADLATAINDADITDRRRKAFAKLPKFIEDVDFVASLTPDLADGDQQEIGDLTANITVNAPSNMEVGDWITLTLKQDATGGRTVTWFSGITWLSADYSINDTASKKSVFAFRKLSSTTYEGYLVGKQY